ncbi:hypothetical protein L9F63_003056, partial [Diploptera punctata]
KKKKSISRREKIRNPVIREKMKIEDTILELQLKKPFLMLVSSRSEDRRSRTYNMFCIMTITVYLLYNTNSNTLRQVQVRCCISKCYISKIRAYLAKSLKFNKNHITITDTSSLRFLTRG